MGEIGNKANVQVGKGCHPVFFTVSLRVDERPGSDVGMVLQQAGSIVRAGHATAKKRSNPSDHEHVEPNFNTVWPSVIVFQHPD